MTMSVTQVRLPEGLIKEVDKLVDKGLYSNKSDVIRDAIRKLVLEKQVGSIPNTGDSVKEIREIRKKLSKEKIDLEEINKLGE
jgi:Arc/MetJ-type ribon-helix-helix transcriptional regulator